MIRRDEKPRFGLLEMKRKKIYAAILRTQYMILQPDPGILWLVQPDLSYAFTTTPVSVRATGDFVDITVTRENFHRGSPFQPAAPDNRALRSGSDPTVITEVDTWVRVSGIWMLQAVHYYLI